jgi:hypothetical protein
MPHTPDLAAKGVLGEAVDTHTNWRLTAAAVGLKKSSARLTRLVHAQNVNCNAAAGPRYNFIRPEVGDVIKLAKKSKFQSW